MKSSWRQHRLERLFQLYNKKYWQGRLPQYVIVDCHVPDHLGLYDPKSKRITINIRLHQSDREIRATVLHEMAHAADGSKRGPHHGYGFFREIERLLRNKAPLRLGCSEIPENDFLATAVPAQFPLCRKAALRLAKMQERAIPKHLPEQIITEQDILQDFEEVGWQGFSWKQARGEVGKRNGLLDVGGHPINLWAEEIIEEGQRAFRKARKSLLLERAAQERNLRSFSQ